MNSVALFTDVSVNPQLKLGIGGYLLLPLAFLQVRPDDIAHEELSSRIIIRRFEETSSTKLEVQTVLWALEELRGELTGGAFGSLQIYTDSQCVAGLSGRRSGLLASGFVARRSGQPLIHAALYREFYAAYDRLGFQIIKVSGHSRACSHDIVQRIFSYVDRKVRKELAGWIC